MFSERKAFFLFIFFIALWTFVWSSTAATPIQPKGTDGRYGFVMQVPCLGAPQGRSQVPVTEREEAAAVSAYLEGRISAEMFVEAMISADEAWNRLQLIQFTSLCAPSAPGDDGSA